MHGASMQVRLKDEYTRVYDGVDEPNRVIAELPEGSVVTAGSVVRRGRARWVEVRMRDGRGGYIDGDAIVHAIREVARAWAPAHEKPDTAIWGTPYLTRAVRSRGAGGRTPLHLTGS